MKKKEEGQGNCEEFQINSKYFWAQQPYEYFERIQNVYESNLFKMTRHNVDQYI